MNADWTQHGKVRVREADEFVQRLLAQASLTAAIDGLSYADVLKFVKANPMLHSLAYLQLDHTTFTLVGHAEKPRPF